jgi:3-methyladenine DNA glycosylase/8-oxoguanine DNA glycosylase
MFQHHRLWLEEAEEHTQRRIKEADDDKLYKQLGHSNGIGTWIFILIILITAALLLW